MLVCTCAKAGEELIFWNFWDQKFILPVIERFEQENPGIKIRSEQMNWGNGFDKVVIAMANGRAPDICELGSTWMGRFMAEGALLDISSQTADLKQQYLMWEAVTSNGRVFGLPWLVSTRVLFYNRRLLRQAGLNPDDPPQTWAELLAAARQIHDPKSGIYGFGMNAGEGHILYKKFMPFVWGNGGSIFDSDGRFVFASPATREALDFYLQLKNFSYCEKQDLLDEAFKLGRLGLAISGSWNFARYPIDAPQLDFGVAMIPRPAENRGVSTSFLGGQVLTLFKGCRNPEAATRFIRFLATAANTLPITREAMVSFPADQKAYSDPFFHADSRMQVFVEQMKTARHPPVVSAWVEIEKIINEAVEKVIYGTPAAEALSEAADRYAGLEQRLAEKQVTPGQSAGMAGGHADVTSAASGQSGLWLLVVFSLLAVSVLLFSVYLLYVNRDTAAGTSALSAGKNASPIERGQKTLLFLSPWLLTFLIFWLYPLFFSFILSFCSYNAFHPALFKFAGLQNYLRLLADHDFARAFLNTLVFVVATTPVTTALALALALLVNSLKRGSQFFRSVFFLPSIISIVVTATIFKSVYAPVGILNRLLAAVGIPAQAWLVDSGLALPAIIVMNIWVYTGYYMVLYLAALKAVPMELYEAADVDGASDWQQFFHITLPQIRYMTVFILTVNTIRNWQVFAEIFTLTRGGPVGSTDTLVHHLYETAFRYHEMGYASAMAFILLVVILAFSLLQMRAMQAARQ